MIDNLDFGARDSYPSRYNYNYASSMYLDSSSSAQGAARAYTEETRPDKMEGCEPCRGFSSIYYDKCYAKEGNQCVGRSYPQCQRGDPHCTQMEQTKEILYSTEDEGSSDPIQQMEGFNIGGKQKEKFSMGDYELTDQRIILIAIIFVCLIMLMNDNSKKKNDKSNYAYTVVGGRYTPYLMY